MRIRSLILMAGIIWAATGAISIPSHPQSMERTAVSEPISAHTALTLAPAAVVAPDKVSLEVQRAAFTAPAKPRPKPIPQPIAVVAPVATPELAPAKVATIRAGQMMTSAPVEATPTPKQSVPAPEPTHVKTLAPVQMPVEVPEQTEDASVIITAKKYLGTPYVWGGTNPAVGLDCSGFVQLVFKKLGYDLPRVARAQAKEGTVVPSLSQAKPGDLLGMRNGSHIAIYLGNNKIIHSPRPGSTVSIRSLTSYDDVDVIRRVL